MVMVAAYLVLRLHAGADDCSDTAVGRDWLPGALQQDAASVPEQGQHYAPGRQQGMSHHICMLQPLLKGLLIFRLICRTSNISAPKFD